jgi:hypothetical protein
MNLLKLYNTISNTNTNTNTYIKTITDANLIVNNLKEELILYA